MNDEAFKAGYRAFMAGYTLKDNPYTNDEGNRNLWIQGFEYASRSFWS